VLVDRQRFTAGMAGDELEFGVGQAGVAGKPGECLMPERMGCGLDARLLGLLLDDLLDPPRGELAVPPGLEEPTVVLSSFNPCG
jgi:hypothetical protein